MKRFLISALIAALVVIAVMVAVPKMCEREPAVETPEVVEVEVPAGFTHEPALDVAGYYMPLSDVQVGDLKLNHIAMGAPSDFEAWEDGEREFVYGPILLHFDDVASPTTVNELGGEGHERTVRILPGAYNLSSSEVSFSGEDPALGLVAFSGRFDTEILDLGRDDGSSGDAPALIGALQIGETLFEDVRLTYWIGD